MSIQNHSLTISAINKNIDPFSGRPVGGIQLAMFGIKGAFKQDRF